MIKTYVDATVRDGIAAIGIVREDGKEMAFKIGNCESTVTAEALAVVAAILTNNEDQVIYTDCQQVAERFSRSLVFQLPRTEAGIQKAHSLARKENNKFITRSLGDSKRTMRSQKMDAPGEMAFDINLGTKGYTYYTAPKDLFHALLELIVDDERADAIDFLRPTGLNRSKRGTIVSTFENLIQCQATESLGSGSDAPSILRFLGLTELTRLFEDFFYMVVSNKRESVISLFASQGLSDKESGQVYKSFKHLIGYFRKVDHSCVRMMAPSV